MLFEEFLRFLRGRYMKQKILFCLMILSSLVPGFLREARAASGITADVSSLDFGDQADGTLSTPQSVTLTKQFNGDGIIGAILLAGEDPQQYVILEDFCSGAVLGNQESCSLSVAFGPSIEFSHEESPAQADLQIIFQDPPALSIPLSGNILAPNIESNVSSLDFGKKVAGQLSKPQTVILTNTGEVDLIIGTASSSGGDTVDFAPSLDECSFQILPPGESCTLELKMRPTELGDRSAQFTIESNDPDQPLFSIDLFGIGTGSGGCTLSSPGPAFSSLGLWFLFLLISLRRIRKN